MLGMELFNGAVDELYKRYNKSTAWVNYLLLSSTNLCLSGNVVPTNNSNIGLTVSMISMYENSMTFLSFAILSRSCLPVLSRDIVQCDDCQSMVCLRDRISFSDTNKMEWIIFHLVVLIRNYHWIKYLPCSKWRCKYWMKDWISSYTHLGFRFTMRKRNEQNNDKNWLCRICLTFIGMWENSS